MCVIGRSVYDKVTVQKTICFLSPTTVSCRVFCISLASISLCHYSSVATSLHVNAKSDQTDIIVGFVAVTLLLSVLILVLMNTHTLRGSGHLALSQPPLYVIRRGVRLHWLCVIAVLVAVSEGWVMVGSRLPGWIATLWNRQDGIPMSSLGFAGQLGQNCPLTKICVVQVFLFPCGLQTDIVT